MVGAQVATCDGEVARLEAALAELAGDVQQVLRGKDEELSRLVAQVSHARALGCRERAAAGEREAEMRGRLAAGEREKEHEVAGHKSKMIEMELALASLQVIA